MSELNVALREIFIAVPVSERLPECKRESIVNILDNNEIDSCYYDPESKIFHLVKVQVKPEYWLEKITAIPLSEEELDTFILGFVNWKDIKWQYVHVAGKFLPNIKFLDKYGSNYKSNSELLSIYKEELSKKNNNTPKEKEDDFRL